MAKKCPPGKYYCFDDKKCKKIPRGYHIGARGYLARDDDNETKKNGNGNSNGNGNGGNGAGNGNGGSGGGANGNGGGMGEEVVYEVLDKKDIPHVRKLVKKLRVGSKTHAKQADDLEVAMKEESNPRIPRKKGQPAKSKKHSDLYTDEDPKGTIHGLGFKDVATAKKSVSKIRNSSRSHAHKIQAAVAMEQRAREMGKTSEAAVYRKYINAMKKKTKSMNEATMTPAQKRKDTMLKKKYDKSDMKKNMKDQYGEEEGKKIYFATIRKQAMKEGRLASLEKASVLSMSDDPKDQDKAREIKTRFDYQSLRKQIADKKKSDTKESVESVEDDKYNVSEEGLRAWFGKSSGTTKSGRKVKGWVQVGGKYDGKPCARQPGQKSTPKCVSSSKRRSMSKKERDSAARRKRAADPNQPQKSGAAKPTKKDTKESFVNEAKDKKGKGSGSKDACYHKVKSRYSVWPSAYASGALVKCRKVGAANWGNKSKNEGFSPMQVAALEAAGMIEIKEGKKCWKGYEKKGTQKLFGKTYNRCVKKEEVEQIDELSKTTTANYLYKAKVDKDYVHSGKMGKYAKARDKGMKRAEKKLGKKDSDRIKYVADYDARSMKDDPNKSEYPRKIKVKEGVEDTNLFPAGTQGKVKKVLDRGTKFMKQNPVGKVLSNIVKPVNNNKGSNYTSGGKVTNEGTSYGLYKGDGKPKGAMKDYLDKKKKKEEDKKKVVEAIQFLRRKKKESEEGEERKPKKAMDAGARLRRKKQRQEYAEKISGSEDNVPDDIRDHVELASESKIRLVKNGHTYRVILTWRGKTYMIQMFVPSVSKPTRKQVEKEVQKIYPDAKVLSFLPRELEPGEPTVMVGEEKEERDEYGDLVGGPKISKKKKKENLEKNEPDEDHTTTTAEEYVTEDDMKGMSVKSGHKRPTKSGAGMTKKGVAAYRRRNPGSKLQTAVTGKVKKGSKDAKRRKSYCARSAGQMKKFPKAAKDPNSRLRQARRRWKC
jgi:hypothetical protein